MQEILEIGGSKESISCKECESHTRCYIVNDFLGNREWLCLPCIKFIYGYKGNK